MRATRLFHSVVIVGSGLLAGCGSGQRKQAAPDDLSNTAEPDAGVIDAARIDEPPPPPRIHAVTPEKLGWTDP